MDSVADIVARPTLPIELVAILAVLGFGLCLFGLWRGLRGAWFRLGALLALVLALLDPAILTEEREPLDDVAILIVDESASQTIEDRAEATAATADAMEAQLTAEAGDATVEVRRVVVAGDGVRGTELMGALDQAVADLSPDRIAGVVYVTDGVLSDADRGLPEIFTGDGAEIPVHALVTGRADEFDRRLVVESAPAYGLVGEEIAIRFRVEQTGETPPAADALPRVEALVDGVRVAAGVSPVGRATELTLELERGGSTVVELRLLSAPEELTTRNNSAAFNINGVRDRLRVLLVSGEPHAGERTWRNLLKSDPSVDLVHFTILRLPGRSSGVRPDELALIEFPAEELFQEKLDEFDLIIFDRYRHRRFLSERHLGNITRYVRDGGAVLVSAGEAFASRESLFNTPLRTILPAVPTFDVLRGDYHPRITELGLRHPVTRSLLGRNFGLDDIPSWGRWFRQIEIQPISGDVIMSGASDRPLLVLDRVGDGRVAMLATDQMWLWARGYDGGGPQAELLRRLAHWLMQEPDLEEESLTARPSAGGFIVERRSLADGPKTIVTVGPDGETLEVELTPAGEGLWRAEVLTDVLGLHRIEDGPDSVISLEDARRDPLSAVTVVGPPAPEEFADPVSTVAALEPLLSPTGGSVRRLADGAPDIRRVAEGRAARGDGWIGFARRDAYEVRGVALAGVAPGWLFFAIAALFAVAAWRVEGR